jgi:hypothetical protein
MSEEFLKDICRTLGHDWKKKLEYFQDECDRCKVTKPWSLNWTDKLAKAMAAPLKTNLDYSGIAKKIIKVDVIKTDNLPIYDADLPNQDPPA